MKKNIFVFFIVMGLAICLMGDGVLSYEGNAIPTKLRVAAIAGNLLYLNSNLDVKDVLCFLVDDDYSLSLQSEQCVNFDLDINYPSFTVAGDFFYVSHEDGFSAWNYRDPANPYLAEEYLLRDCTSIFSTGEYLFACSGSFLNVYKLTVNGTAIYSQRIDSTEADYALEYNGKYYLSSESKIFIYEQDDRGKLVRFAEYDLAGNKSTVCPKMIISNGYLFMIGSEYDEDWFMDVNSVLQVYKVKVDGDIAFVGRYSMKISSVYYWSPLFVSDFAIKGDRLFVSNENIGLIHYALQDYYLPYAPYISIFGFQTSFQFIDSFHAISVNNTKSLSTIYYGSRGVHIIDEYKHLSMNVNSIIEFGDYTVAISTDGKFLIYQGDISESNLIGVFNSNSIVLKTQKYGNYLYIFSSGDVRAYDMSNPVTPIQIDYDPFYLYDPRYIKYTTVVNGCLFVGDGQFETEVYDVSDPEDIGAYRDLNIYAPFTGINNYIAGDRRLYKVNSRNDIDFIDFYDEYSFYKAIQSGNFLVAKNNVGISIYNISSPESPVLRSNIAGDFADFEVRDTLIYAMKYNPLELIVYSMANPDSVKPVCSAEIEWRGVYDDNPAIYVIGDQIIVDHIDNYLYSMQEMSGVIDHKKANNNHEIIKCVFNGNRLLVLPSFTGSATLKLIDSSGRIIMQSNVDLQEGKENELDASKLKSGVFFLEINTERQKFITKAVKL